MCTSEIALCAPGEEPEASLTAGYVPLLVIFGAIHHRKPSPVFPAERAEFSGIVPYLFSEPLSRLGIR
jgi:hypothetical protein